MASEPALSLKGVTKRFGGLAVSDAIGFDVSRGERVALIGPNGAGKTTLFNLISGVYGIDSGEICLDGAPIQSLAPRHRVRAGLSRSFQNIRLMPNLSVVENIMLGQQSIARGLGAALAPIAWQRGNVWRKQAQESMKQAGIDVDPDASIGGLPYGMRKKIEVVRALMGRPRVLMLDEPAAGLNPRETAELSAFLKSFAWPGLSLLVVEHDMAFVRDLCERTIVLNFGRLIYEGPTSGVQHDPLVREAYLGKRKH